MTIEWSEGVPLLAGPILIGWTETSPETAGFWEGVRSHRLRVKRCRSCGRHLYPRRILCPACHSDELDWIDSTGLGTIYSYSTIHRAPTREFEVPYTIGIVELDEEVYMFGRIVNDGPGECSIGDRVEVRFAPVKPGGEELPVYQVV